MAIQEKYSKLLRQIVEAATAVGIYDRMFLAFGSLLGSVRPTKNITTGEFRRGVMSHDHDMDVGFLDSVTAADSEAYFAECGRRGLMDCWASPASRVTRRGPDNRIIWFSVKAEDRGAKCCQWFMFEHHGFLWHGKAGRPNWTTDGVQSVKGIRADYFANLVEIEFEGVKILAPEMAGSALDRWYPGWHIPAGGCSSKKVLCKIPNWSDRSQWRILEA